MEKFSKIINNLSTSPGIIIWNLSSKALKKIKEALAKNKKKAYAEVNPGEVISTIKERKKSEDKQSFIEDFKYQDTSTKTNIDYKPRQVPMEFSQYNKEILKNSIIISLFDTDVSYRKDIRFIGVSRIDGRSLYQYIGNDFKNFDLPYTEIVYFEDKL